MGAKGSSKDRAKLSTFQRPQTKKRIFALVVAVLLALNFGTLVAAYPETFEIDSGCCAPNVALAKDFSAYYSAGWRLFNNPSQVYTHGLVNDGEYPILPQPEGYKYL